MNENMSEEEKRIRKALSDIEIFIPDNVPLTNIRDYCREKCHGVCFGPNAVSGIYGVYCFKKHVKGPCSLGLTARV